MPLTKADVFARLRDRGATSVEIEFSGGNDEGGADSIVLYAGDEPIGELRTWAEYPATDPESQLIEALTAPIVDRWGGFDGDFSVSGKLTWDVTAGTVSLSGEESEMQPFEETLPFDEEL